MFSLYFSLMSLIYKIISAAEPAKQEESMEIAVNSTEQEKNSDLEANNDLLNALRRARRK